MKAANAESLPTILELIWLTSVGLDCLIMAKNRCRLKSGADHSHSVKLLSPCEYAARAQHEVDTTHH